MNASERRNQIINLIKDAKEPVSGFYLAKFLNVSRQVIVGDVALLRAGGHDIIATPKGYIMNDVRPNENALVKTIACQHSSDGMEEELCIMVDEGASVLNVIVEHPVYGQITGDLHVASRHDVTEFLDKLGAECAKPLSQLTNGIHLHTIECRDQASYERILRRLKDKGYLL